MSPQSVLIATKLNEVTGIVCDYTFFPVTVSFLSDDMHYVLFGKTNYITKK